MGGDLPPFTNLAGYLVGITEILRRGGHSIHEWLVEVRCAETRMCEFCEDCTVPCLVRGSDEM